MREIKVGKNEAGQRLIRIASKYLRTAPDSFLYKMLRKKNIVLNGRKATGREILSDGDLVRFYLSEDTVAAFGGPAQTAADDSLPPVPEGFDKAVIFENEDVLLFNKPAGMLSQKAKPDDHSLVEMITRHMLDCGEITAEDLATFTPGIISRLDRNTSGIILAGKSLAALQYLNELARGHQIRKIYEAVVEGIPETEGIMTGYWVKDHDRNCVRITEEPVPGSAEVLTRVSVLSSGRDEKSGKMYSRVSVELMTGKGHQIRAHLAGTGHPLCGDSKYGGAHCPFRKGQMLHARKLIFPEISGKAGDGLAALSRREFTAPYPDDFTRLCEAYSL